MIVGDVEDSIDDGGGEAGGAVTPVAYAPGSPAHVPVIQMQAAGAKDLGGEIELLLPVVDDRSAEKALRPLVHLAGYLLGDLQERGIAMDGQLEVALVVQRHARNLTEGVLAVEHPSVGARQQGVS